jgi:hypothetical protein
MMHSPTINAARKFKAALAMYLVMGFVRSAMRTPGKRPGEARHGALPGRGRGRGRNANMLSERGLGAIPETT